MLTNPTLLFHIFEAFQISEFLISDSQSVKSMQIFQSTKTPKSKILLVPNISDKNIESINKMVDKSLFRGWVDSSVVERLPTHIKDLGSSPSVRACPHTHEMLKIIQ